MRAILLAFALTLLANPAWGRVSVKKVTWSRGNCDLIVQYKGDHVSYAAIRGALLFGQSTDLYTLDGDRITVRSVSDTMLVLTFVQTGIDGAQFVVAITEDKKNYRPVNSMAIWVHGPNAEAEFKHEVGQMTELYGNSEERGLLVLAGFFSGEKANRDWLELVNLLKDGKLDPLPSQGETVWQDKPAKREKDDRDVAQMADEKKTDPVVKKKKKRKSSGPRYEEVRGPYFNFFY